jgi:hypothetical protein
LGAEVDRDWDFLHAAEKAGPSVVDVPQFPVISGHHADEVFRGRRL